MTLLTQCGAPDRQRFARLPTAILLSSLLLSLSSGSTHAQTLFTEKTEAALIGDISSESWGTAVGDFNNDGWMDISMLNHRERASLYRNNGDGTLSNVMLTAGAPKLVDRFEDHHQSVFADVDGDGDDDLMYVGNSGFEFRRFISTGTELIVSGPQTSSGDAWDRLDSCNARTWPALIDADHNGVPTPIACHNGGTFAGITPSIPQMIDMVSEDFDGDLVADIFALRNSFFITQAKQVAPNQIEALLETGPWGNSSFTFQATGNVTFNARRGGGTDSVTLSGGTDTLLGRVDLSYDPGTSTWTVEFTGVSWALSYVEVSAPSGVSNVTLVSKPASDMPIPPRYLKGLGGGNWQDNTNSAGINTGLLCASVTAADFDNDMDVDVYAVCRHGVENITNRLYINNGNGVFSQAPNAGGAAGAIGANLFDGAGTGDSAVTADFNNDGAIDLFLINGLSNANLRRGGPHQYFENVGNSNRWINLKLRGASPNFDAVSARVVATAGGVGQLRFQDGGLHRYSQDSQRIHFGMGNNGFTDLDITWPNGQTDSYTNVATNQFYEVTQGVSISAQPPGLANLSPLPVAGDDCGTPTYSSNLDQAVFLYQTSCGSNTWNVRVAAGGENHVYTGRLTATSGTISNVSGFSLEGNDSLSSSANSINFSLAVVGAGLDGFSFTMSGDGCLELLSGPDSAPIILGSGNGRVDYDGVNPNTLALCGNGPLSELSIGNVAVDEDVGIASVPVTLSSAAPQVVTVTAFTRAGSATGGSDFYGTTQPLTFAVGETTKTVDVQIVDDNTVEQVESFEVRLTAASGATVADNSADVTIFDNDAGAVVINVEPVSVDEDAGTASVRVSLSTAANTPITAGVVTTSGGTATPGQDYYGRFSNITFTPGDTEEFFNVPLLNDAAGEPDETIAVRIISSNGAVLGARNATITIVDDD